MENAEFARLLSETADLMEIAGEDVFRIRSYRNAAVVLEGYPEKVESILRDPSRDVTEIQGIGKGLAHVLGEILERGSFERRDEMLEKYPPTALEFLKIQGLGPKTVALIIQHYRVSTVDDLEKLCLEQKLRDLPRMGAKSEEKILRGIAQYRQGAGRFLLSFASAVAAEFTEYLSAECELSQITPAGSLRRGKETVGDVDLLITGQDAAEALERFTKFPKVVEVLGKGVNKASVLVGPEGLQVDLRALPAECYGAALQYFTGSKEHNVALRNRAIKMGFSLSEYGLTRTDSDEIVAGATEAEVYEALGLAWIPPELRENQGEIDTAETGPMPKLVDLGDIRGDLHMHTTESDGRATVEEMAEAAAALGYDYIAITDHSKALAMANGLDEKRVVAFAKRVRKLNSDGLGIRVFSGIECDILKDGAMDLAEDALAELDLVIGSVHSYMNQEPAQMTDRLFRALECPHLHALGHPTGRMLLRRDAFLFDFEQVAAEAAKKKVCLEINASPERLDLHAPLLRAAKAQGVRFIVCTDAHHPKHLSNMNYGVLTARRGWLTRDDILNTLPPEKFLKALRKE